MRAASHSACVSVRSVVCGPGGFSPARFIDAVFLGKLALLRLCAMTLILPVLVAVFGILAQSGRQGLAGLAVANAGASGVTFSLYGLQGILLAHVFLTCQWRAVCCRNRWKALPAKAAPARRPAGMRGWHFFRFVEWPWLRRQPARRGADFMLPVSPVSQRFCTLGGGPQATIELAIFQALSYD